MQRCQERLELFLTVGAAFQVRVDEPPTGRRRARMTLGAFLATLHRLYEQGAPRGRLGGPYVRSWLRWARAGVLLQLLAGLVTYLLLVLYFEVEYGERPSIRRLRQLRRQMRQEAATRYVPCIILHAVWLVPVVR